MRVWHQDEYEALTCRDGYYRVSGDLRAVDLGGRHRVLIGAQSILGDGARLGDHCELGGHCEIGEDFKAGRMLVVGERCRFGEGARIGEWGRIERGVRFGPNCVIEPGTAIAEEAEFAGACELFGVPDVLGSSLLRISPVWGSTMHAFLARGRSGEWQAFISMRCEEAQTLGELLRTAAAMATAPKESEREQVRRGRELLAAVKYAQTRVGQIVLELPTA